MKKEEKKNTNNHSLGKTFISYLVGDIEKWKKLPEGFKDLKEDFRNPKEAFILILIGIICFSLTYGGMQYLRYIQENAQYCDVMVDKRFYSHVNTGLTWYNETSLENKYNENALPIPESNHSYRWYLDYYKEGRKQPYVGLNCTWDFKRYWRNNG